MLERADTLGGTYNIADPEPRSWWDLYRAWRRATGARRLARPLPCPVRRVLDVTDTIHDLGWRPRPLVEAFRETAALERGEPVLHDRHASNRERSG